MTHSRSRWRIAAGKTVYETPWLRVREYEALAPTDAEATYGIVELKNLATGVLPIAADGTTYLVGQDRFALGRYSWELREGGCPKGCAPQAAAARELAEEAGLKAASWLTMMENVHLSNSVTDERAFAYFAWDLSPSDAAEPDNVEAFEIRRVPLGEALQMAVDGEISDAFSLVMLFKADHLLKIDALPADLADAMRRGLS